MPTTQAVLQQNLNAVRKRTQDACRRAERKPSEVTLVAVTKKVDAQVTRLLYELGVRELGESRPQNLWQKYRDLPDDVNWHLIGHWQTNKVRRTLPMVKLVHSVDRLNLADTASDEALRLDRSLDVTLQVNLTGETSKHGFTAEELREHLGYICSLQGLHVVGLMTMARMETDMERCRPTFRRLRELRDALQIEFALELPVLSMGMTRDFEIAVEEGATHIRVGSALFEGLTP